MMASKKATSRRKPVRQAKASSKKPKRAAKVSSALLDKLVEHAKASRARAYAPYSHYEVGAAIATRSGRIYAGCNVENSSFGASICAERNAIVQMVASGDCDVVAVAVVTGDDGASPCGICRQVLAEFADDDVPVVMVGLGAQGGEAGRAVTLGELLPAAFRLERH